ncbi:MAG: UPF0175 family protein [Candidatus Micrarchaeota archaeon]
MAVESFTLPPLMKEEIEAIPKTGLYSSTSEFLRDAIRAYLAVRRDVRTAIALELYKENKISTGRAAEITDVSYDEMKKILVERKLWKHETTEEVKKRANLALKAIKKAK